MSLKVSEFVKNARETYGLSQRELAALVNKEFGKGTISRSTIAMVETGDTGISVDKMSAITTALYNWYQR